jgi:predicted enzyme related to lactoylglutathione lyase
MTAFTLNWFGMAVQDVPATTDFYSKKLGFHFWQNEDKSLLWRYFETRRMTFELFKAHSGRFVVKGWGNGQAFRPAILVNDLSAAVTRLQNQGVLLSHEISEFGHQIEITGPEEIRWSLIAGSDIEIDWAHPVIGGIELKAANLEAQKDFYTQIFGMVVEHQTDQVIHLTQPNGEAWLRIQAGGTSTSLQAVVNNLKPAFFYPIWISYETKDIKQANTWLQQQNVTIIRPITYHKDWEGTDIIIADVDGNAIQVVQYGKPNDNEGTGNKI